MPTGALLNARFSSWCRARKCRGRIAPGDRIVRTDGRAYHERCAPRVTLEDKTEKARPVVTDGRWESRRDLR